MAADRTRTAPRAETVLLTGASSGIGRELARLFAADGSDLVLVARREERLRALADELATRHRIDAVVLPADLSDPAAPAAIQEALEGQGRQVDVLVNNAGFGARGVFAELDPARQLAMIQVNVAALTDLTRRFLPGMLARNRGGVLNVGSQAGFLAGPRMAVYYATKAFVLSFTEGLAEEVRGRNLQVSVLAPGPVATEFADTAGMRDSRMFKLAVEDALEVARAGHRGFRRGQVIVVPSIQGRLAIAAIRFTPRAVLRRVVRAIQS